MADESPGEPSFQGHVGLLESFIDRRRAIVDRLEQVLNAQKQPEQNLRDRSLLSRIIDDCFYSAINATAEQQRLKGGLQEVHWASGFRPRQGVGLHYDLINPAEMMVRGFHCWQLTRWPGRNGRLRYAEMLFNVYLLRSLEFLSMRLWDSAPAEAGLRLTSLQQLVDALWRGSPADQPVLVRDARWLIPLALSPATDELAPYFDVMQNVSDHLDANDSLEIQRSHVRILGGHLTSQIRYYCVKDAIEFDDQSIILRTRTSNALDFALLIQGLVPLLDAYERACETGDTRARLELAGSILQGISPDPEVFLNRTDLLGPCSMIEQAFIGPQEDGRVRYTAMGERHIGFFDRYREVIPRLSGALLEDCAHFRPKQGECSAYGVISGNPTNVTELMAMKTLKPEAPPDFSLEDAFADGDQGGEKLAWVNGWRDLPHVERAVQRQYDYPETFAGEIFSRIEAELSRAASGGDGLSTGRLLISSGGASPDSQVEELPARFVLSSDRNLVAGRKATACDESKLLRDRQEGFFAVSYPTVGGWVGISKDLFTEVLARGADATISGLPEDAAEALRLACLDLAG